MSNQDQGRPRLLVVDDEPMNLNAFRRLFDQEYDIAVARSGAEALAKLRDQEFDLLLTDFSMPMMDGVELAKRAVERHSDLGVLVVTAFADFPKVVEASESGLFLDCVRKPWKEEDLRRQIEFAYSVRKTRDHVAQARKSLVPPPKP